MKKKEENNLEYKLNKKNLEKNKLEDKNNFSKKMNKNVFYL